MKAAESFKHLKACLVKRLAPSGFIGAGDIVWCKVHDTVVVVEVQKDRKYSTKEEVRFTVNAGISVDALRDVVAAAGGPSYQMSPRRKGVTGASASVTYCLCKAMCGGRYATRKVLSRYATRLLQG